MIVAASEVEIGREMYELLDAGEYERSWEVRDGQGFRCRVHSAADEAWRAARGFG